MPDPSSSSHRRVLDWSSILIISLKVRDMIALFCPNHQLSHRNTQLR